VRQPRVALINPPTTGRARYGALAAAGSRAAPLGLCSLAAALREAGAHVRAFDAAAAAAAPSEVAREVIAFRPDLAGITAVTMTAGVAGDIAAALAPHVPVVMGGPHVSAVPEETLARYPGVSLAVIGEGEETLVELVFALAGGCPPDAAEVPGLMRRLAGGGFARTAPRPRILDLDRLPVPAFDLLAGFPAGYRPQTQSVRRLPSVSLMTSRGCTGRCTFCSRSVFGRRVTFHSAEYVYELILWLRRRFGVRDVQFEDDCFILDRRRLLELCRLLQRRDAGITWSCLARADRVDAELLAEMRAAGCWAVQLGVESGSQAVLDRLRKDAAIDGLWAAIRAVRRAGLRAKGFFMVGCPRETEASLRATERLALGAGLNDIGVCYFTPFPGTAEYARCRDDGAFSDDWSRMTGYEPLFLPAGLTRPRLRAWYRRLLWRFYLRPRAFLDYLGRITSWQGFRDAVRALLSLLRLRGHESCKT